MACFWDDFPCTKLVLISENYLMQAHFNISLKLNIIRKINQLLKKNPMKIHKGFLGSVAGLGYGLGL